MNFLRGVMGGQSAGPQHTEAETVSAAPGPGWGRTGREPGVHSAPVAFLSLLGRASSPRGGAARGRRDRRASGTRLADGPPRPLPPSL
ncbi:hypothetical protein NN561_005659 [Cricetulus griseus]